MSLQYEDLVSELLINLHTITSFEIVGNVIMLTMSVMHVCIADILSQYTNALLETPVQTPSVGHTLMPPYVPLRQCWNYVSTEGVESV